MRMLRTWVFTSFRRITIAVTLAGWRRGAQRVPVTGRGLGDAAMEHQASRVGFEPTTKGLKVPCSAAELPARGQSTGRAQGAVLVIYPWAGS